MKKFGLLVWLLAAGVAYAQTGAVVLKVEGILREKGGELSVGIFEEKNFPKVGKQLRGYETAVVAERMEVTITHVPVGTYGVAVFQDIDKNKDLKTNFIGLPQEPIGFSNDARINFGPPDFDDAKFSAQAGKEIILKIILR